MTGERVVRRLAAILAADVVGYSRLMGRDENGTLAQAKGPSHRAPGADAGSARRPAGQADGRRCAGRVSKRRGRAQRRYRIPAGHGRSQPRPTRRHAHRVPDRPAPWRSDRGRRRPLRRWRERGGPAGSRSAARWHRRLARHPRSGRRPAQGQAPRAGRTRAQEYRAADPRLPGRMGCG